MPRGFDNADINIDLLLDLKFREGSGTKTQDWAKPHHPDVTLTGAPSWVQGGVSGKLNLLDFNSATPDFVEIAAADSADLDFTTEDFTLLVWINRDTSAVTRILQRGLAATDGWHVQSVGNLIRLTICNPAGELRTTSSEIFVPNEWHFLTITRRGANVIIYHNGIDDTVLAPTHVDPITSNRKLLIGIDDNELNNPYDGQLYRPRIWERTLSPQEIKFIYNSERHLFGV